MLENYMEPKIYLDQLLERGFAVVPEVFDTAHCAAMREVLDQEFALLDSLETVAMIPSRMLKLSLIRDVPFASIVVKTLQYFLGESYVVYPNFTTRRNLYVPWHVDVAFRGDNGGYAEQPSFLQCAIYLQSNDNRTGGGIEVVPGSHKRMRINDTYYVPASALEVFARRELVNSKPGDLVLFDGRLLHASSGSDPSQANLTKYGIFWTASRTDARVREVLTHLKKRTSVLKPSGEEVPDPRFADMKTVTYPTSYPDSAVAAQQAGLLRCATLAEA
jgi:Phytanoyl-CoA dioxygenase (PhyH)